MKRLDNEGGFTILEVLVALFIFGAVATAAISLTRQQNLAFATGASMMDATQNYRFSADLLERNLAATGNNTVAGQPFLIYADSATIAFNADYATADPNDYFAVYHDPSAAAAEVRGLTTSTRITIPGSAFNYPAINHMNGPVVSSAETIVFYFRPDSTTSRTDDFVLRRQVNGGTPEVVARDVVRLPGSPFFRFQEELGGDTIAAYNAWVPAASLPLRHSAPSHESVADTGAVARIDRIRNVQVSFSTVSGLNATQQQTSFRRVVRMPNAGKRAVQTCGDEPIFVGHVSASQVTGELRIDLSWNAAVDELAGEKDVIRYAIFRRSPPAMSWGEPYFSVPAGLSNYVYSDTEVEDGTVYQYAVAAQDCTPNLSSIRISNAVPIHL